MTTQLNIPFDWENPLPDTVHWLVRAFEYKIAMANRAMAEARNKKRTAQQLRYAKLRALWKKDIYIYDEDYDDYVVSQALRS